MRRDDARAKANLGYVPDATEALPELLVREFIDLVRVLKRVDATDRNPLTETWMNRLGVASITGQSIGSLSFGQRKRVCLVAALSGDPALLVLDEPSNGLDPHGVTSIVEIVDERRKNDLATLLSTNDAALAARIGGTQYRLAGGTLAPV